MSQRDILLYRISALATRGVFPRIYDDFLEIDELAKGEDGLLGYIRDGVLNAFNDKELSTAGVDKIAEYESHLGLDPTGLSLEQRRQRVIGYINRSRELNETDLHALVQSLAGDNPAFEHTDPEELILEIGTRDDAPDGSIPAVGIIRTIMPTVPQNLVLHARVNCNVDMDMVTNHAHFGAISSSLPRLVYRPAPAPTPPPTPGSIYIGTTTACPAGTTTLYSPYFWMYAFASASGTNWYRPNYYQNAMPPVTDSSLLPVGGTRYEEVVLTDGMGGTFSPSTFRLAQWSDKPEFYMDTSYTSRNSSRNGAIVKFGTDVQAMTFDLPADMYTISGTTITWDMSHPLMVLLQGVECSTN